MEGLVEINQIKVIPNLLRKENVQSNIILIIGMILRELYRRFIRLMSGDSKVYKSDYSNHAISVHLAYVHLK